MKKITTIILCSLLSLVMYGQRVQTITHYIGDGELWEYLSRDTYNYDGNGYHVLNESWEASANTWENSTKTNYVNNNDGMTQEYLSQFWNSELNIWEDRYKMLYTYSGQNIETITYQTFSNGSWKNTNRTSNTYDGSGYQTSVLNDSWDASSNTWIPKGETIYTNNPNGTVQEALIKSWDISTDSWKNIGKSMYTYSGQTIETFTYQIWVSNSWQNSYRNVYTYSGQANELITSQSWISDEWQNFSRESNIYDGSGYKIKNSYESWESLSSSWVNSSQTNYTNNSDGTVHEALSQLWDTSTSSWENSSKVEYTYSTTTGIDDKKNFRLVLYPNPSTDRITIELEGNNETSYSIYDTQGKLVQSDKFSGHNADIDISTLSPNLYFVAVQQKDKKYTTQFIKK